MLESLRAGAAKLCIMSRTVGHQAGSSKNLIQNSIILSPIPCPQFLGQNLVLKFGPRTRIYTERSAFRDQNLVPKSRPEVCKKMRRRRFQVLAELAPDFWGEIETCQPQRREKTRGDWLFCSSRLGLHAASSRCLRPRSLVLASSPADLDYVCLLLLFGRMFSGSSP